MARKAWKPYVALLPAGIFAWCLNTAVTPLGKPAANAACAGLAVAWLALAAVCAVRRGAGKEAPIAGLLAAGGFAVGLCFLLQLPHNFSWHDLASYSADFSQEGKPDGHLGYIAYLAEHGLPTMNPLAEGYSVFYNPPLYHIIQAGFMKLNLWLGISQAVALENLQVVTFLCAQACVLVTWDLCRLLGLGARGQRVGVLVIAFQPSLWIFGATLNNDILSILCILVCILFTLRWERSRRMSDILGMGLSLGAGMAVKLSVALLIPCIAVVFVIAFFRDQNKKRYFGQYAAFLAVSVPEAVAWPLYHLIAFHTPLNYVRLPAETINVSGYSLWQRFGWPNWFAIRELFYTGVRKTDHNFWMQTLKTGVFDELTLFEKGTGMWYAAYGLMTLFALLLAVGAAMLVRLALSRREGLSALSRGFLLGYAVLLLAYYLKFNVNYPYICSANFRYIQPVCALAALALATFREKARCSAWAEGLAAVFALGAVFAYCAYFFQTA